MDVDPTSPDPVVPALNNSILPEPSADANPPDPPASQETPPAVQNLLHLLKKPPQRQSDGFYDHFAVCEWSKAVKLQIVSIKYISPPFIRTNTL